jgi:hypothetical protein
LFNVILLLGYIVRCIFAEAALSEHLKTNEDAGKVMRHDYRAVFATIEVLTFAGQAFAVFAFFRWSRRNTQSTRKAVPAANLVQACFNALICALVYAYFHNYIATPATSTTPATGSDDANGDGGE